MTPTPKSTYQSGKCEVRTYANDLHELWYGGRCVGCFGTFRAAVRYQLEEFP